LIFIRRCGKKVSCPADSPPGFHQPLTFDA
jgi:hypothetical protein